jgi:hypothetical protein
MPMAKSFEAPLRRIYSRLLCWDILDKKEGIVQQARWIIFKMIQMLTGWSTYEGKNLSFCGIQGSLRIGTDEILSPPFQFLVCHELDCSIGDADQG